MASTGPKKVVIGIQARTTNTRLPGKVLMKIAGIPMLDRVIKAADKSAEYINNRREGVEVEVALLVPEGDTLADLYRDKILTIEGPEDDVLKRYYIAQKILEPDYMVRLTSDCPLIPAYVITKHIVNAAKYGYDYVSNVDPKVRTHPDGFDCEVISKPLLEWANQEAQDPSDREHVTTYIRANMPGWARKAHVFGYMELSQLKLSVDTEEDLLFVQTYFDILTKKMRLAKQSAEGFFRL